MITKFDTSASSGSNTNSGGGGGMIIKLVLIAAAAYATYRFIIKPYLDKQKQAKDEDTD
jgi:hypothetical protein